MLYVKLDHCKRKQPLQETDILPYPMAKSSLDLSGPYPTSMSGNRYIIAFVDWFSGWPENLLFLIKQMIQLPILLLEHIFPRFGCSLLIGGGRVVRWCWVNFQCRGVLQFGYQ